jgi:hypothetical protein
LLSTTAVSLTKKGRLLAEITRQDDLWLEVTHDYIQWLFPTREISKIMPCSPLIDKVVEAAFHGDELLRRHLLVSFIRMLSFYGLVRRDGKIVKGANWCERKSNWFIEGTHNDLRITRILKSLSALGLRDEAEKLMLCLEELRVSETDCGVNSTAYQYWRSALQ